MTIATRPRSNTPSKSLIFAFGESVSRRSVDRKSTRLNSSHVSISYAVFCLKKKKQPIEPTVRCPLTEKRVGERAELDGLPLLLLAVVPHIAQHLPTGRVLELPLLVRPSCRL